MQTVLTYAHLREGVSEGRARGRLGVRSARRLFWSLIALYRMPRRPRDTDVLSASGYLGFELCDV